MCLPRPRHERLRGSNRCGRMALYTRLAKADKPLRPVTAMATAPEVGGGQNNPDACQLPYPRPNPDALSANDVTKRPTITDGSALPERNSDGTQAMTATNDYFMTPAPDVREFDHDMPVMLSFEGSRALLRTIFRIVGTALILTAPMMWVMPGSYLEPEVMLMKLGVSLFFFLCGLALLMRNHVDAQPEAYFDPIRRELRVLQKNDRGRPQTVMRRSYDSLGGARITARAVELWDVDGSVLMKLPVDNPAIRQALRMQLSGLVRA